MSSAPTWKCFIEGIKALRDHGWQTREGRLIADDLGYSPTHISQVFQGKRKPSGKLQESLAEEYGLHVEDVLKIGREIIKGNGFFPFIGQIEHLPSNSEEQARTIVALTNKQFGIEGQFLSYRPEGWDDFLAGKISPVQLYESYANELKTVINLIKKREKRVGAKNWT